MIKRRVIVDYKNVPDEVLQKLAEKYPHGYSKAIIKFTNSKNEIVSAVPIEVGDTAYLVKVSTQLQKMVDDYELDDLDDLGIDAGGTAPKDTFDDEEYGSDEDDDIRTGYDDDEEESLDDHLDEAENIADDSDDY